MAALGDWTLAHLAEGPLRSLLVDGVIAGVGGVLVFLPQILILFFFILVLEDSGYLPRAAFLLDNLMGRVGLSGRAFIPLLSSFACAVPGIMATRTITHWRDRLATIMVAPLMTCSARLPVYALLIGAFVPERHGRPLQPARADAVRPVRGRRAGGHGRGLRLQAAVDEEPLPAADAGAAALPLPGPAQPAARPVGARAHLPAARGRHHLRADGAAVVPEQLPGAARRAPPARPSSTASPAGSARRCSMCLRRSASTGRSRSRWCPGWRRARWRWARWARCIRCRPPATRSRPSLAPIIAGGWSLATAYALLAWYVFAPQCLSTLAVTRRETNSLALAAADGRLPVRAGLCGGLCHLPRHAGAGGRLMQQWLLVGLIVAACAAHVAVDAAAAGRAAPPRGPGPAAAALASSRAASAAGGRPPVARLWLRRV